MESLSGNRIVVTGGSSGIGAALVAACRDAGATVANLDRNTPQEPDPAFHAVDVTERSSVQAGFAAASAAMDGIDGVIHAAGIFSSGPASVLSDDDLERVIAVNLKGTMNVNIAAFDHLREEGGHILNFGSAAGIRSQRRAAHYAASKGGVGAWSRCIAQEWAQHSIRVNIMAPAMKSAMNDGLLDRMSPDQAKAYVAQMKASIPLGGWFGDPATDLAPFVVFLMGDGSRFMTGQTFSVDGGAVMLSA